MDPDLAAMRSEYGGDEAGLAATDANPMDIFTRWFADARESVVEPNAMVLSTTGPQGPSTRTVLMKGFDERGFSFFTHQDSRKGLELHASPHCALLFGWYELHRQVRVEGVARLLERAEVEAYFAQRPRGAQLGAWASRQSSVVADRAELEHAFDAADQRFEGCEIPAPPTWGGYVVEPEAIEFWQGRANRLHDRLVFTRTGANWLCARLAP